MLALWVERCFKLTSNQSVNEYTKNSVDTLVEFIQEQGKKRSFNEELLIKTFNENGIYLVIEDDLPGTKTRGAFKVLNNKPAVFLTRKYKRVADIYFALLHELAHCKSDFNRAKSGCMVTYEGETKEDYEIKADKKALNWMFDDKMYQKLKENIKLLENVEYNKCFAVYRLALDKIIGYSSNLYQLNNPVIDISKH